ncbi:MAG: hypothetical protein JWM76_803 [Pseudonocardiales bacterium]|nr:hypothetical protein [Pseudonocardiales bacterium]
MEKNNVILTRDGQGTSDSRRWVTGKIFGLEVPADLEALLSSGPDFLTRAFRASGALAADNSVCAIVGSKEFIGGGTGRKFLLTIEYEVAGPGLPEQLFIKFSRNFDNELWDRGRFLTIPEVTFAVLSRAPDFPVPVPATLFADVDPKSGTGLIISECITYGSDGVEPLYLKCMDYDVPDQVGHYKAIMKGLATLSGAHRSGRLAPAFDREFPYDRAQASAPSGMDVPEAKVVQRAKRMFEFVEQYPKLFPANVRTSEFREQFMGDIPDVVAAGGRIGKILHGNPDFIAFSHWNANIDNCWFEREPDGSLRCGFLDWANAGQISVAQSITGAISGAEPLIWDEHLDELLGVFIDEYAAQGGPLLDLDELRLHILLMTASGLAWTMGAPVAVERAFEHIDTLESHEDSRFRNHENARIQLHMMTRMLNVWQRRQLGDVIRALNVG